MPIPFIDWLPRYVHEVNAANHYHLLSIDAISDINRRSPLNYYRAWKHLLRLNINPNSSIIYALHLVDNTQYTSEEITELLHTLNPVPAASHLLAMPDAILPVAPQDGVAGDGPPVAPQDGAGNGQQPQDNVAGDGQQNANVQDAGQANQNNAGGQDAQGQQPNPGAVQAPAANPALAPNANQGVNGNNAPARIVANLMDGAANMDRNYDYVPGNGIRGHTMKMSEFLPSSFFGDGSQSAQSHIDRYQDYITTHLLNDRTALERFQLTLSGVARSWLKRQNFNTFAELQKAFLNKFSPYHSSEAILRALSQKKLGPHQSLESYYAEIIELADRRGCSDSDIKDWFLNGLPDNVRNAISILDIPDLPTLVDKTQKFIETQPQSKTVTFSQPEVATPSTPLSMALTEMAQAIKELQTMQARNSKNPETSQRIQNAQDDDTKSSHTARGRSPTRGYRSSESRSNSRDYRHSSRDRRSSSRDRRSSSRDNRNGSRDDRSPSRDRMGYHGNSRSYSNYRDNRDYRDSRGRYRGQRSTNNVVCNYCGLTGHRWIQCHVAQRDMKHKQGAFRGHCGSRGQPRGSRAQYRRNGTQQSWTPAQSSQTGAGNNPNNDMPHF